MAVTYPDNMAEFGAQLQALRVPEDAWEWLTQVDGSNKAKDKIYSAYSNSAQNEADAEADAIASIDDDEVPGIVSSHETALEAFEEFWLQEYLGKKLLGLSEEEAEGEAVEYEYDANLLAQGQVQINKRLGPLGRLYEDMVANSQLVQKPSSLSLGSLTAGVNIGTISESAASLSDHTLAGTLTLECIDDTIGATKLRVSLTLAVPLIDGTTVIESDNDLTISKAYQDGPTGFSGTYVLGSVVESGDGGSMFASTTVTTPGEADSDKGQYFIKVVRMSGLGGNPDFRIYWYNSSSRLPSELIATRDITGTSGTEAITMQGITSVIATTFSKTNAASALPSVNDTDDDIYFDIDNPRVGDRWTKAVTNNQSGNFNSKIARRWRISLPSSAGAPTITDSLAADLF